MLGWTILIFANPLTSSLSKYYEKTKSNYSKDIDHLVSFNKNGLWIKENLEKGDRIISAAKPKDFNLIDVTIFHVSEDNKLIEKIKAKKANVENFNWILEDVMIFKHQDGIFDLELSIIMRLIRFTIMIKLQVYLKILIRCLFQISF